MESSFYRTEMLLGKKAVNKLKQSRVAVFGIGGVGGYVCEALVRSGIGAIDLIDYDTVSVTNLNRQIIATRRTIGQRKVDVMKERILEINPEVQVRVYPCFFLPENASQFPFEEYHYIVDAVDMVTAKIELILKAKEKKIPIISSMGAGNKLDGSQFQIADIYQTKVCPLAKVMRRELKKRGIEKLKVVYSEELPILPKDEEENGLELEIEEIEVLKKQEKQQKKVPGSVAFVPSIAGLLMAGEVVKDLVQDVVFTSGKGVVR